MEIIKNKLHMDRIKARTLSQVTLEDDINLPETRQDMESVQLYKGNIIIDEMKTGTDVVNVKGHLSVCVLYHAENDNNRLVNVEGKIPFEEKIHFQGVMSTDSVHMEAELEDLTVGLINSRKLRVRSVITFHGNCREEYVEELPVGVSDEKTAQFRKVPMQLCVLVEQKRDVLRMKEEVALPSGYPNLYQILWYDLKPSDLQFRAREDRLEVEADMNLSVLYEAEGEFGSMRTFETTIPYQGKLDCPGCREGDYVCLEYMPGQVEAGIRPDPDGEERSILVEWSMEPVFRIYREQKEELLTDLYGVTKEINTTEKDTEIQLIQSHVTGKTKAVSRVNVDEKEEGILQILHSEGTLFQSNVTIGEKEVILEGVVSVRTLYVTGNDDHPYDNIKYMIPYEYHLETGAGQFLGENQVHVDLEQLQVTMLDARELEAKAILSARVTLFDAMHMSFINEIDVSEIDKQKLSSLPGMSIYVVGKGDNLWNIGKKYYVTVDELMKQNSLTQEELVPGQKLLIVKGAR